MLGWKGPQEEENPDLDKIEAEFAKMGLPVVRNADIGPPKAILDFDNDDELAERNKQRIVEIAKRGASGRG